MDSPFTSAPAEIRGLIYDHLVNHPTDVAIQIRNAGENHLPWTPTRTRSRYYVTGKALMRQCQGSYETTYYYHRSRERPLTTSFHQQQEHCFLKKKNTEDKDKGLHVLSSFQDESSGSTSRDVIIYAALMRVSRLVHTETSRLVYGQHAFDFGSDVEAVEPFLADLTAPSRGMIRAISLYKRGPAPCYGFDSDYSVWRSMCRYLSRLSPPSSPTSADSTNVDFGNSTSITGNNTADETMDISGSNGPQRQQRQQVAHYPYHGIRKLRLVVECGRPSFPPFSTADPITDQPREMSAADFQLLIDIKHESLDWITELARVGGIEEIELMSHVVHCPLPSSTSMILFAALSASVDKGFAEYLRKQWRVVC